MDFLSYLEKVHIFILMRWSRFYNQFNRWPPPSFSQFLNFTINQAFSLHFDDSGKAGGGPPLFLLDRQADPRQPSAGPRLSREQLFFATASFAGLSFKITAKTKVLLEFGTNSNFKLLFGPILKESRRHLRALACWWLGGCR